jgi:hypothetical protein
MANKNYGWLWYFGIVLVLAITATAIIVNFNLSHQLKAESLEKAQALWKEKGPKDYLLAYTIRTDSEAGPNETRYFVKVKDGKAFEALVEGIPQAPDRMIWYGMPKLLDFIDEFLEKDAKPGAPRTYTRALFDPTNGALGWYVRSVMSTRQRVEIIVDPLRPLDSK